MKTHDTISYDTAVSVQRLKVGNPIFHGDVYAMVTALITDPDGGRVVVQATADDDGRVRVTDIAYDTPVHVGTVIQYGIDRPGQRHIMPIYLGHGAAGLSVARAEIAKRGGRLMVRTAIPDAKFGQPVDDFRPAPRELPPLP